MNEYDYNTCIINEYNRLKKLHSDWSEDELYTEAQSIVSNAEFDEED